MTKEIWKPLSEQGLESYEVSNFGRVRNKNRKILKQRVLYGGYANCCLCKNGKIVTRRVNRLVAFAFCSGYKEGFVANHIDHNRLNNHANNLEWCSQKDNMNNKICRRHMSEAHLASPNSRRKKVIMMSKDGEFIKEYNSARQAARDSGVPVQNISSCCRGKLNHAGGYKWKYII